MHYYVSLKPMGSRDSPGQCRGHVSDDRGEYLLEIANNCLADEKLLSFAALMPEIEEFLLLNDSALANMLMSKWTELWGELRKESRQPTTEETG